MAIALVGTIGAVSTGAASAAVTPAWGTSENRTANNLLVLWVGVTGSATLPAAPSGWTIGTRIAGTTCSANVFYKVAAGTDAAPTVAAITSGIINARLGEYSGTDVSSGTVLVSTGTAAGATSPQVATNAAIDGQSGSLMLSAVTLLNSAARTNAAWAETYTNGTAVAVNNGATSTASHYGFSYAVTTSNAVADSDSFAFTTTQVSGVAVALVSFRQLQPALTQASYRLYADGTETGSTAVAAQDTAYTADLTAGDVNLLVRTRLQSTNAAAPLSTDDFALQWEKNASGTWNGLAGAETLLTSTSTFSGSGAGWSNTQTAAGQSFLGDGKLLSRAGFQIARVLSPAGNITCALYAHSGTFGSGGIPTGSPLVTATNSVVASSVALSAGTMCYFTFTPTFTLANGTPYFIVITVDTIGTTSNCVSTPYATTAGAGNEGDLIGGVWHGFSNDFIFEIYTSVQATTVTGYSSSNLTDAAATTNRLGAGTGSFVAGQVSEDGVVDDFTWTANNYTELLYAVTLKQADLANSDTLRFRVVRNGATTGLTYTQTPTINVTKTVGYNGTGSGAITFAGSGTATVTVTPTGTGAIAFAGSGTATVTVNPTGTGAIVFAGSGTASYFSGVSASGTGAIAFGGSGAATVTTPATGTGAIVFAGSGAATVTTPATGTGAMAFAAGPATAKVTLTGTGTGPIAFAGSGVSTWAVTAGGTGAITFAGSGAATVTAAASGSGAMVFAGAGTAAYGNQVPASGTGAITFAGSGTAKVTLTATATGAIVFAGTGLAQITRVVAAGSGAMVFAGTGSPTFFLIGVGTGAITFAGTGTATVVLAGTGTGAMVFAGTGVAKIGGALEGLVAVEIIVVYDIPAQLLLEVDTTPALAVAAAAPAQLALECDTTPALAVTAATLPAALTVGVEHAPE